MANPQLEYGHTRIANELMEQLMKLYLAPNQWKTLVCIIRKTYGFHKKVDYITNTQICNGTGLLKANVSRALKQLQERNIITRNGKYIGLQKDWEQWEKLSVWATEVSGLDNSNGGKGYQNEQPKLSIRQPELSVQTIRVISPQVTQKEDTTQKKLSKRKYGEFQNVLFTQEGYQKLKDKLGSEAESYIEKLSSYMKSTGKRYKDHYATILNWYRRDKEGKGATNRNSRALPATYAPGPEYADD